MNKEYIVLHITGGIGKNIMSTSVLEPLKKKYPSLKIIVVASWPEIFMYSPYVHKVFRLGTTPYFYQDYIERGNSLVMAQDPYLSNSYINREKHFIECLFDLCDLEYNGEQPKLNINFSFLQKAFTNFKRADKKLLLIQSNGGGLEDKKSNYSWARDIPKFIIQQVVDKYSPEYNVLQICKTKDHVVKGATPILPENLSYMDMLCVAKVSDKRLLIDSCVQHACAAWNLPSTVLWNATSKESLGYDIHYNIEPKIAKITSHKLPNSYLHPYEIWGAPLECPYTTNELYDIDEILDSLEKQ